MNTKLIQDMIDVMNTTQEMETRIERLLNYDTAEEQEAKRPGSERVDRCNLSIEIGGPATHAIIRGLTRDEIERLRPLFMSILKCRRQNSRKRLIDHMREVVKGDEIF